ncbi:MAG: rhodanese-like domain-containing protein [Deltaproteobacteria bacterium]|nr:rhodanese-like domain-containing protein [Deltaproteobacteria bacterium]
MDVRSVPEFNGGSAPGAKSVPLDTLPKGLDALTKGNKNKPLILFCRSGARSS